MSVELVCGVIPLEIRSNLQLKSGFLPEFSSVSVVVAVISAVGGLR